MSDLLIGLGSILDPITISLLLLGTIVGIIFGAIPGLTAVTGVSLLLPFTFGTTPQVGISLLAGVWVGGVSGGFIAAALLGIPGTPSSIATCFDAYPLTQKGQPVKALGTGIVASVIGTTVSVIVAAMISPLIAAIALKFGPWEYFGLGVAALTMVGSLAKDDVFKGLAAAFLGIAFRTIGVAPIDGNLRFTFGSVALNGGINLLALVLGIFAIKQILKDYAQDQPMIDVDIKVSGFGITLKEITSNMWNIVRSFFIGLWIGFLPGMGSGLSNMVAYAQAKQSSKHPEEFGKGCVDGIWASEVSNNAAVGAAAIPMLTLGIPGDSVTAILLGGLMIHGIQPGPLLFTKNPEIIYVLFAAILVSAIFTFLLQYGGMRLFPMLLKIPQRYLFSVLIVMSFVGAFASNNYYFDIWIMLVFAVVGLLMDIAGLPISPMILGFILGPMVETNLRRGLTYSDGSFIPFITRPISGILLAVAVVSIVLPIIKNSRSKKNKQNITSSKES